MILADIDDKTHTGRIVLRPNYSWTWRYNIYLLSTLLLISLAIGISFLMMGAWVILPFSILEMSVVLACMYYSVRQCSRQEVITVSEYEVRVEKGMKAPDETFSFQRLWSRFMVQPPKHRWDPAVVTIRSHGNDLELGSFLSRSDKEELISLLKRVVPAAS